jgi:hypothetical protein
VAIERFLDLLRHGLPGAAPATFWPPRALVERTAELKEQYARTRRVIIPGVVEESLARAVAEDLPRRVWNLASNTRVTRFSPGGGHYWNNYWSSVCPRAHCRGACWALCGFGASLLRGRLRSFIAEITSMPNLFNRLGPWNSPLMVAHAYAKGCYLEAHDDQALDGGDRRSVAFVWHGSEGWQPGFGGLLRFCAAGREEDWSPRFNDLHVFEVGPHNLHEVTLVTEDRVRYSVSGWWYQ